MFFHGYTQINNWDISATCPYCGRDVVFEAIPYTKDLQNDDAEDEEMAEIVGLRRCPNPGCKSIVTILLDEHRQAKFFTEQTSSNSSHLPPEIADTLHEAEQCRSTRSFRACAMMIRKTVELLCDNQGVKGKDLKERIANLQQTVILPKELLQGIDELRLLGNDAAHVKSTAFSKISEEEVDLALEVVREVLKAVYQYQSLLARLQSLKQSHAATASTAQQTT